MKEQTQFRQSVPFFEVIMTLQKMCQKDQTGKGKSRAAGHLDNRQTERTPLKCFRCGSQDHLIAKCPKPPQHI